MDGTRPTPPSRPARVVQLSDTHLRAAAGVPPEMHATLAWLSADPPDLVVHTGDVVYEDPDDAADRAFARVVLGALPCPLVVIPGNHDVGGYGEDDARPARLDAFRAAWGDDRFAIDVAGWRLVGVDAYLLGDGDHDAWVRREVAGAAPVAVFVHQPLAGDPDDGWEMPPAARQAFDRAIDGADVRLVASGHRHCAAQRGHHVWAPSTTLTGAVLLDGDPRPGIVEHHFEPGGRHRHRVVHPGVGSTSDG